MVARLAFVAMVMALASVGLAMDGLNHTAAGNGHMDFAVVGDVFHTHANHSPISEGQLRRLRDKVVTFIDRTYMDNLDYVCGFNDKNKAQQHGRQKSLIDDLTKGARSHLMNLLYLAKGLYHSHVNTLLFAFKLKFFTLLPLFAAAMLLIAKASGLAGFFFAMFVSSIALGSMHHR